MRGTRRGLSSIFRHRIIAVAVAAMLLSAVGAARAQGEDGASPPVGSWAGQLDTLARWLERHGHESECVDHCYVLDRLQLSGSVEEGALEFVLEGAVLAEGPVAVPLFGPPDQVRIDQASLDDGPARIGFEGSSYFLFTDARRFTLRGRLTLQGDLAISIPGPLNSLEAELSGGRLVEGARLSGLSDATVHFERGSGPSEPEEPTVFQLSRAVRVGREIGFEYRLVMRSGNDLGVVRLPLRHGEEVLEVAGSTGWRVEEGVLVIPTSGRNAEVTITGSMAEVGAFEPDPRSTYEWWLLESDPEHRVTVEGSARQFDSAESPIDRSEPSSRLFMVQRGQQIDVSVERLTSAEVLGAVVRSHGRAVVLTRQGDLVAEDRLEYENNGIDYLIYSPEGRAIYLDTDGRSERIMHKRQGAREIMVPLRTGTHKVRVQTLSNASIGLLGGRLEVPTARFPLTASRATVTVGLPEHVRPLALVGGERVRWFVGFGDLAAVLFGFLVAFLALRRRRGWPLGAVALAGLWFLSGGLYVLAMVVMAVVGAAWVLSRFIRGAKLGLALAGIVLGTALLGMVFLVTASVRGGMEDAASPAYSAADDWAAEATVASRSRRPTAPLVESGESDGRLGNRVAQVATAGVVDGVTPVALPLPGYRRSVTVSRELVTEDRPFEPELYYVTSWAILPLVAVWLLCLLIMAWLNRRDVSALVAVVGDRLSKGPAPAPAPAPAQPVGPAPYVDPPDGAPAVAPEEGSDDPEGGAA